MSAAIVACSAIPAGMPGLWRKPAASHVPTPDLVNLRPGVFAFRAAGEFTRDGMPATAPIVRTAINGTLAVMKYQVTGADYRRCVEAGACPDADRGAADSDRPAVKISWRDAHAYAAWLSRETGAHFRLPTDQEWAYAAAGRFNDDALPELADVRDPGRRALAMYDRRGSEEESVDTAPQRIGSFGENELGLLDVAGNVWEWTDTCFERSALDSRGEVATATAHCGVRVVEGRHRAYLADFIRDARAGGCSIGTPPSNLGFRLVREDHQPFAPHLLPDWMQRIALRRQ